MSLLTDVINAHDLAEKLDRHADACEGVRARVVRVNGTTEPVYLTGNENRETELNAALGSQEFECMALIAPGPGKPGMDAWMDGEGLFNKQSNVVASSIIRWLTGLPHSVHGDVLFTGGPDSEGDTLPLTKVQDSILSDMVSDLSQKAREIHLI